MYSLYKTHKYVNNKSSNKRKIKSPRYSVRLYIELLLFLRRRITDQVLAIQPECLIVYRLRFMLPGIGINVNFYHYYIQQVQSNKCDKTQRNKIMAYLGKIV